MKTPKERDLKTWLRISLAALAAVALTVVASTAAFADQPHDAWITTKVKMGLLTSDAVDGLKINVDTIDGMVTLHGKVASEAEKRAAEQAARRIEGVREVRNFVAVVPAERKEITKIEDKELQQQVETVLKRDAALADSSIKVKSVNGGIVVLAGDAKTLSAHRRALEDARAVQGVRQVASEIRSPNELGDEEIYAESIPADKSSGMAQAASDAWITTKVKVRLMAEPGLSPIGINIDTRNGIVTLFGTVSTDTIKRSAEAETKQVQGVQRVQNELQVVPEVAADRVEANDAEIEKAVEKQLSSRESLKDAKIDADVENGVVRLTGTVASHADRITVLTLARSTRGTKSVIDDMRIEAKQSAAR